ncbi:MAG: hypothetical protein MRJ65_00820 [Candidatus Brocadiaceae bacterium]|nr:hypothetical protein [Candidatus Brocadiaceae bacterium]
MSIKPSSQFPRYNNFEPLVPVWCVTPDLPGAVHRFFDTSPFSPSGRYLALTRISLENRSPVPGDHAEVVLVDLETGEQKSLCRTYGWDTQLGAQVQWGADDHQLFFNDMDISVWKPFGIKMDPFSGERTRLDGTVYMVSPDGKRAASPCLLRVGVTQRGYGVLVPPEHIPHQRGASAEDGVFITDTATGECKLLISFARIIERAEPPFVKEKYTDGDFYGFHVKWNPQGTRLMFIVRWRPRKKTTWWFSDRKEQRRLKNVITMDADGKNIRVAIPDSEWGKGGHHPNWCPDGEHVMMNLKIDRKTLRFVQAKFDGSGLKVLCNQTVGSGHPTLHQGGRFILTDTYLKEPMAFGDGTTPLRWIDVKTGEEKTLVRIRTQSDFLGIKRELRVDPHPAWDREYRRIAFNALSEDGTRMVYVADVSKEIGAADQAGSQATLSSGAG